MKDNTLIIIAVVAVAGYLLYKKGAFGGSAYNDKYTAYAAALGGLANNATDNFNSVHSNISQGINNQINTSVNTALNSISQGIGQIGQWAQQAENNRDSRDRREYEQFQGILSTI